MKKQKTNTHQVDAVVIPISHVVLQHRDGIAPTKKEIKQAIIQRLLDIYYAPFGEFYEKDRETWDRERQILVLRCEWNKMTVEELLSSLSEG